MARIAVAVLVVTFALAVSACGGDSGSSSADQTTAAETTTVEGTSAELILWLYARVDLPVADEDLVERFRSLSSTD